MPGMRLSHPKTQETQPIAENSQECAQTSSKLSAREVLHSTVVPSVYPSPINYMIAKQVTSSHSTNLRGA